jgi:hypothetical protein
MLTTRRQHKDVSTRIASERPVCHNPAVYRCVRRCGQFPSMNESTGIRTLGPWPLLLASLIGVESGFSQPLNTEALVNDWFKSLNALADWNGVDDPGRLVDRFAELYDSSVLQFTGPNENQIGPVTYVGIEGIHKWADHFARAYSKSEFRIQVRTEKLKTAGVLHAAEPPWGGKSVAVEVTAFYTLRENHKRFAAPGAVLFAERRDGRNYAIGALP